MSNNSGKNVIRTVCALMDGVACGLSVEVDNGVITRISPGDLPNPNDKGACHKGLLASELVYHKDRLRYPLKRTGQRGEGKWQRISWDEALDSISEKLKIIAQQYEPGSIAWLVKSGPATLKGGGYSRLASLNKNSWVSVLGFGDAAAPCADLANFGRVFGEYHLSRFEDPKISIIWGQNTDVTEWPRMRRIMDSKKKGCKIVVIDPRYTSTALKAADEYLPIRPGTDTALALSMINVIIDNRLQDEHFIRKHTIGPLLVRDDNGYLLREKDFVQGGSEQRYMVFDTNTGAVKPYDFPGVNPALTGSFTVSGIVCRPAFQLLADNVQEYRPEKVAKITGISADIIRRMAKEYATQKPASINRGWGLQRTFHGDLTCRAINMLATVTGNLNINIPSPYVLNKNFPIPAGPYTQIPIMSIYDHVIKQKPFPIKAIWFAGMNYASQMPNQNKILKEVFPNLELIVVSDLFMTATAGYADFVLPVSSPFECMDLQAGLVNWTNYLHLRQKAIEPLYESKPDFRIAAELAIRMGLGEYFDKSDEEYLKEILTSDHPTMEGISLEKLKEGPVPEKIINMPQKFNTPTGTIEFYVEKLVPFGQQLPVYLEPVESTITDKAKKYPLSLLSSHSKNRVHTMAGNCPSLHNKDPEPTVQINPADANQRNIKDGEIVLVFNDKGRVKIKAKLSEDIMPGVVNIDEGWWPEHFIEGHLNALTHDTINPAQAAIFEPNAAFCDVLVEVEKD